MSFFVQMGFIRYPMLVAALFLAVQVGRAAHSLIVADGSAESSNLSIHAVLGWGLLSAVLGVLGTMVGLSIAAGFIEAAGEVSASVVWGGVKVALSPSGATATVPDTAPPLVSVKLLAVTVVGSTASEKVTVTSVATATFATVGVPSNLTPSK